MGFLESAIITSLSFDPYAWLVEPCALIAFLLVDLYIASCINEQSQSKDLLAVLE
jgi:hypothetical protein